MSYQSLYKLFYIDKDKHKSEYEKRFNDSSTIHFDIKIGNYPAFICPTPDIYKKVVSIERTDKKVQKLCSVLPGVAIKQFKNKCLIDEIVLTNKIEGVHSTRKEITDILNDLSGSNKKKRFQGLVKKYVMLMQNSNISIQTCQDVRKIYDDIFYEEIKDSDSENLPDGKIFRKDSVSVYSPSDKEIHHGIMPEDKIIELMTQALKLLNDNDIEVLFKISAFHYLFGYIHPFYDGNGRTSRFISSYLLSLNLNDILGYRISYTIKENIKSYYDAFKICNHPTNMGDLTPFIDTFLEIIDLSEKQLNEALSRRVSSLNYYEDAIKTFPANDTKRIDDIYYYLVQASLFSELGISTQELMSLMNITYATLSNSIKRIPTNLIIKKQHGHKCFYSLNLDEASNYIRD